MLNEYFKSVADIRGSVWATAVCFLRLHDENYDWLVQKTKADGGVEAFAQLIFHPLRELGEDYRDLLAEMRNGLTKDEYVRRPPRDDLITTVGS